MKKGERRDRSRKGGERATQYINVHFFTGGGVNVKHFILFYFRVCKGVDSQDFLNGIDVIARAMFSFSLETKKDLRVV